MGDFWDQKIVTYEEKVSNAFINEFDIIPIYVNSSTLNILNKFKEGFIRFGNISNTFRGLPYQSKLTTKGEDILRGRNVGRYNIHAEVEKVKIAKADSIPKIDEIKKEKIISQNIIAHVQDSIIIMATFDKVGVLTLDTVMNTFITNKNVQYEYILGILNSKFASWYYYWFVYCRAIRTMHFDKYYIDKLPIPRLPIDNPKLQQPLIALVDKILTAKGKDPLADTSKWENEIDARVFHLYGLTEEEMLTVLGSFPKMKQEEKDLIGKFYREMM